MCGNCGWFTQQGVDVSAYQRRAITRVTEALLSANTSRGTDATGVAVINAEGKSSVYKKAVNAFEFLNQEKAKRQIRKSEAMMLIGHTRLGTMGTNIDKNAHPFVEGSVVGAHNGIIWNHWDLDDAVKAAFPKASRVDSQAAFRLLSVLDDPIAAMKAIEGQAVLIWHDARRPLELSMVRHNNPLSLVWVQRIKTLFWSSEATHLWTAITAAYGTDGWYPIPMEEDELFIFRADDLLAYKTHKVEFAPDTPYASKTTLGGWPSDGKVKGGKGDTDEGYQRYSTEWCPMCGELVEYEDMEMISSKKYGDEFTCGPCARWYQAEGKDLWPDVDEAVAISDRMIRSGGRSLREESEIARVPMVLPS